MQHHEVQTAETYKCCSLSSTLKLVAADLWNNHFLYPIINAIYWCIPETKIWRCTSYNRAWNWWNNSECKCHIILPHMHIHIPFIHRFLHSR